MQCDVPASPGEFAAWVRPHLASMSAVAARLAPRADRDDVVQDALVRAWTRRTTFDAERGGARIWLLAITADQARRRRRRRRLRLVELVDAPAAGRAVDDDVDLARALAALTRRQRLAVDLHYFVGLSVSETAAVMGCAEGTVKSTLSDARSRLRPLLEESE